MSWFRCDVAISWFFLGWTGEPGKGRALRCKFCKIYWRSFKNVKMATYEINIKRI